MKIALNRRSKRLLIIAVLGTLAAVSTAAIALSATSPSTADPLVGISAAESVPAGVADSAAVATLESLNTRLSGQVGGLQIDQARLLPTRIAGHALYVVPAGNGDLCVYLHKLLEACTSPLDATNPASFSVADPDGVGGIGPLVFGIAADGVKSVSFSVAGVADSVPVKGNVFAYQAPSTVEAGAIGNAAAIFADGRRTSLEAH